MLLIAPMPLPGPGLSWSCSTVEMSLGASPPPHLLLLWPVLGSLVDTALLCLAPVLPVCACYTAQPLPAALLLVLEEAHLQPN